MSDPKPPFDKFSSLSADMSGAVNEALSEAQPMLNRMADRFSDSVQDLAQRGKESALEAEHRIEREARHARRLAESYIQHAPLKSVLIAAGTGAATALAVSWYLQSRKH